jgi:lipopolysaccharide export system ATP-binding protein
VVDRVSLGVKAGRSIGLLGPNGAGKTTTFYMTVGLVKPDGGQVFLDDMTSRNTPCMSGHEHGVGYLPQEASIFRKLTVRQNILVILETCPMSRSSAMIARTACWTNWASPTWRNPKRRCFPVANAAPGNHAGLATDPAFMLLDEPFAGIDPLAVIDIKKIIAHLKNRNIGILISDHNVRETWGRVIWHLF